MCMRSRGSRHHDPYHSHYFRIQLPSLLPLLYPQQTITPVSPSIFTYTISAAKYTPPLAASAAATVTAIAVAEASAGLPGYIYDRL